MKFGKNALTWVAIFFVVTLVLNIITDGGKLGTNEIKFSKFLEDVENQIVRQVVIRGDSVSGVYEDGNTFTALNPNYSGLVDLLKDKGVVFEAKPTQTAMSTLFALLLSWFPILLLAGIWIFFMKQMQGGKGGGGALGFGKSRAKMLNENSKKVLFEDVAGIEEAKEELEEIVEFLKDPTKFSALGGKIPRGCLLIGSPGTGKTLLARAIAGEAGVPFFSISGSDFVEMFVGVGASRVRDLFEQGKKNSPCLIFIDEIDAVGRHRGAGYGGGNDEREQTLNQLLVEMDGFEGNEGVIIIAATNRPDVLDPALLRPGRFDRQITVSPPDVLGREQILKVHMKKVPMSPDVEPLIIARGTPGFTGADLANLVNEAALLAARRSKKVVSMKEFEEAKDKVMMGAERKSMVVEEDEKKLTAYHEAGHAIVSLHCPESDPIHKATIIPRGRALGMVMRLPKKDQLSLTRGKAKADMAVAMGGRVAEEMIFGYDKVTSGASSDIKMATNMARKMVSEWGMSDKVGAIFHGSNQDEGYLGGGSQGKAMSETTANLIDDEVKNFVDEGYKKAEKILEENSNQLETLAQALLEHETLTGDEINDVLAGKKLKPLSEKVKEKDDSKPKTGSVPVSSKKSKTKGIKDIIKKPKLGGDSEPEKA